MSYSLESKKRKFHRVLDSLSKPPAPSHATTKKTQDPIMAARERLIPATETIKRVRGGDDPLDKVTTRTTVSRIIRSTTGGSVRPNFVPWDRDRFLERLESFRPVTRWSPKPAPINEVEWAKRGWSCTDYMRITCVGGCGSSVVVKLPDEVEDFEELDEEKLRERQEVRAKVVDEYRKMISQGHSDTCPWRTTGCDATIHRLPVTNPDAAINALQQRYIKLVTIKPQLPSRETIQTPEALDLSEIIKILPPDFVKHEMFQEGQDLSPKDAGTNNPAIDETSFAFAFFGWDVVKDGSSGLLECRACFRRLGLWLYRPKEDGKEAIYQKLSVADEHMDYCPWINGVAQSGTGKPGETAENLASAWEILAQNIRVKHRRLITSTAGSSESFPSVSTTPRGSETGSVDFGTPDDPALKAKDREWWAKIRRVREAFHVKTPRKTHPESKS
ncbi:hypothetical protein VTN31DRAFT_2461 [Thermomyces dupontii]|uniref:uncharacterized protein n=1 Tax=Talaromyces thermophilus TaxID=28565 RepID=UPI0037422804